MSLVLRTKQFSDLECAGFDCAFDLCEPLRLGAFA